jgi:hypothetical protein
LILHDLLPLAAAPDWAKQRRMWRRQEKILGRGRAAEASPRMVRCAVYTCKSTEEGLDREFNSLDAQREAAEALC